VLETLKEVEGVRSVGRICKFQLAAGLENVGATGVREI
jgi:hypothetical protein